MKTSKKVSFLLIILVILYCAGCNVDSSFSGEFFSMDTVMTITAYGKDSENIVKEAEAEINRLDKLLSVQNKNSEIFKLNKNKYVKASDDTLALINRALSIGKITDSAFDITSKPLSHAWGFYRGLENKMPSKSELEKALASVGTEHIKVNGNSIILDKNSSIDLGGIAKGYASGKTAELLKSKGINSALISLGGNVRAVGTKPDGSMWKIGITNPDDNSKSIGTLSVKDKAVITSGGYQRFFEEKGQIYHHIIDTKTGYPAQSGLKSVTIVSEDDTLADALSTALFVMGLEKSSSLYKSGRADFGAVLIDDNNKIYITDNLKNSFSTEQSFEVISK